MKKLKMEAWELNLDLVVPDEIINLFIDVPGVISVSTRDYIGDQVVEIDEENFEDQTSMEFIVTTSRTESLEEKPEYWKALVSLKVFAAMLGASIIGNLDERVEWDEPKEGQPLSCARARYIYKIKYLHFGS